MPIRSIVIPRPRARSGYPRTCFFRVSGGRCVLDITRVVESWNDRLGIWQPEIRLCHLHALEYMTGKPVYLPSFAQQQLDMTGLGA